MIVVKAEVWCKTGRGKRDALRVKWWGSERRQDMTERKQCLFQLIRYVPDPKRDEFVNIGVLLRTSGGEQNMLRFTRDWARVRCLDPDADIAMLEGLEIQIGQRLRTQLPDHPKSIMDLLEGSLSNEVQITDAKAYLPETFLTGLEDLMRLHVDGPRRERSQKRGGRTAVQAAMRNSFEEAGVWALMRKQIPAANYTRTGDPLRIDCGYRNGVLKMFQAISLETNADDAKLLAFAAPQLKEGAERVEKCKLLLTAIIEPIGWPEGDGEPSEERSNLYDYARETMKENQIRVMTTSDLPQLADTARKELRV
jgi:hypothetical protein